jgi:hypothetical protein
MMSPQRRQTTFTTVVGVDDRRVPLFETRPDEVLGSGEDL